MRTQSGVDVVSRQPLRLKAQDKEDLPVLSSLLQDALLAVGEFAYQPKKRRFAATASRFMWEEEARGGGKRHHTRVRTGIHFDGVLSVKSRNVKQDNPQGFLELLALTHETGVDGAGTLTLVFAGGGEIKLEIECIDITLTDISPSWDTKKRPDHDVGDS